MSLTVNLNNWEAVLVPSFTLTVIVASPVKLFLLSTSDLGVKVNSDPEVFPPSAGRVIVISSSLTKYFFLD